MFEKQEEDTVFMETVMNLKYHPHMVLECVPMPREIGEMSPIYFKVQIFQGFAIYPSPELRLNRVYFNTKIITLYNTLCFCPINSPGTP